MACFAKFRGRCRDTSRMMVAGLTAAMLSGCVFTQGEFEKPGSSSLMGRSLDTSGTEAAAGGAQEQELALASARTAQDAAFSGGAPGSLTYAVAAALGYSARVREAMLNVERAGAGVDVAQSGYFPGVKGTANVSESGRSTLNLTLIQPLFDWGKTGAEIDRARAAYTALEYELAAIREKTALEAAQAFIAVKRQQALVDATKKNLEALERIAEFAKERASGGLGDSSEVAITGVHRGEAEAALVDAMGMLTQAKSVYASVTGQKPGALGAVPELPLAFDDMPDIRTAATNTPSVAAALARSEMADHAVKSEKADLLPKLSAEAYFNSARQDTGIGFHLRSPVYNGLATVKNIEAAQLGGESEQWRAEVALRDAVRDVEAFQNQASALRERFAILKTQLATAKALQQDYEDQFEIGQRSLTDLLSVQSDVFRIERSLIEARYNVFDLQYVAANALGILQRTLVQLPGGAA